MEDLLVDRAGGGRHYPGMAQQSPDEARRSPGSGPYVNRRPPCLQIIKMLKCEELSKGSKGSNRQRGQTVYLHQRSKGSNRIFALFCSSRRPFLTFQHAAAFFQKLFRRRIHFNAAVPPDPFLPQNFLPAVDRALPDWWRKAKARLGENTANGEVEWIQNGRFENGLFFKDFSRRSGGSRFPRFSIIFPGIPEIGGQILKTPMVIKPSNQSKPALSLM